MAHDTGAGIDEELRRPADGEIDPPTVHGRDGLPFPGTGGTRRIPVAVVSGVSTDAKSPDTPGSWRRAARKSHLPDARSRPVQAGHVRKDLLARKAIDQVDHRSRCWGNSVRCHRFGGPALAAAIAAVATKVRREDIRASGRAPGGVGPRPHRRRHGAMNESCCTGAGALRAGPTLLRVWRRCAARRKQSRPHRSVRPSGRSPTMAWKYSTR